MANRDILRISKEIIAIQQGADLSIAVTYQEANVRKVQALILGPPGTPYQYGFFKFSLNFPDEYPSKPPKVDARTTNAGRCRFNPNIYAGGKVCLSILGTWEGRAGEQWSSAQGLESVLLSIQSLMSANPFENEPGFEDSKDEKDKDLRDAYCAKIQHETLRIAVIQELETMLHIQPDGSVTKVEESEQPSSNDSEDEGKTEQASANEAKSEAKSNKFEAFNDLLKRRFLWYYENYLSAIEENAPKHKDGATFVSMPFESSSNGMSGTFQYASLGKRLVRIKEVLHKETRGWAELGLKAVEQDLNIAYNLRNQYSQFAFHQKQNNIHNIDISLCDDNPFVWVMTYFGISGSNMDGGMFRIRISISPRFPEEQPRVRVETKMYHHRVSKDGVLCYFPTRNDEIKYHIEAILFALEEEAPPYDPRAIVYPEATKLFWGNENDKKKYGRLQRRSAQESMESDMA